MGADPVGQRLAPARLGVGVARRAEHRDEQVGFVQLARHRIDDRHRVAGPVDEQLVAGQMRLAHDRRQALPPFDVDIAEARVAVPRRAFGTVLLPQRHQRHASCRRRAGRTTALELCVHVHPIGQRLRRTVEARRCEQPPFERRVVDIIGDRRRGEARLRHDVMPATLARAARTRLSAVSARGPSPRSLGQRGSSRYQRASAAAHRGSSSSTPSSPPSARPCFCRQGQPIG